MNLKGKIPAINGGSRWRRVGDRAHYLEAAFIAYNEQKDHRAIQQARSMANRFEDQHICIHSVAMWVSVTRLEQGLNPTILRTED